MLSYISSALIFVLALLFLIRARNHKSSKLPLPPGPRKRFIVGNLFDIPSSFPWETYMEWSRRYDSDIIHLKAAGQSMIILSSMQAAVDLLERRSAIYSDRPQLTMANELMGWDFHLGKNTSSEVRHYVADLILTAFMRYGEQWRAHRRLFQNTFQADAIKKFHSTELLSAHLLLRRILDDPENVLLHLRQMAAEIVMSAAYGIDVLPVNDPYVDLAEAATDPMTRAVVPGAFLVDLIPLLRYIPEWFPGAGFKRKAREWKTLAQKMQEVPFEETKRRIAESSAPHSFVSEALDNLDSKDGESSSQDREYWERVIKATAGTMYSAGTDTTLSALATFILAMLANPEAQKKAQMEIDSIMAGKHAGGGQGLPSFDDEANLPYVSALVREVLRWRPVAPLGFPHVLSSAEDVYRGYRIPAGSVVISNLWAIFHDEAVFPHAYEFKPERFLLDPNLAKYADAAFGFGRRICPARHLAFSTIWIAVASILATFDITKPIGDDGQVIEPTHEYSGTAINFMPLPFKCSIKPRSKEVVSLIQAL
ncbi:cytochrome P450 [Roridomyces roridus]|uniref:Cytochrome P450 n=1 Tax=Roridomyces roridus TaxID=1738132 RepID=A0AAD7B1M1_9AGAR|nr:cytochrome P450 [Roridomyces roridus]